MMDDFDPWADEFTGGGYPPTGGAVVAPQTAPQTSQYPYGIPPNGGNRAGYMDLSYWVSRGVMPDQIFDANGQTRPGWVRTENGYEQTGAAGSTGGPSPTPSPETWTGGGFSGVGGEGSYQSAPRHSLSSLNYPQFNGPQFNTPKPFEYQDFTLPTMQEAQNEPGFDYALKQGIKAFENSKAYLGTYRSGGTIKGLNDYARNMATQNYDKVFERKAQTYDRNRNNAADTYATNYGISRDVFDRNYTSAKDQYAPKARESELNFARDWDVYAYEGDDDYRRWKAMIDANTP